MSGLLVGNSFSIRVICATKHAPAIAIKIKVGMVDLCVLRNLSQNHAQNLRTVFNFQLRIFRKESRLDSLPDVSV